MYRILAAALLGLIAGASFAEGDLAVGEKEFRKCKSCHTVETPAGEVIIKGGKVGPNLYGIAGRLAGTADGFVYGDSLVDAGKAGLAWDAATFSEFTKNPKAFLQSYLDDPSAKSKMTFRLKSGGEDVFAYLQSLKAD